MSIVFKFLEAGQGDAILISADGKNILVDGGDNYELLSSSLDLLKTQQQLLDLVILTHLDDDHINGLVGLFGDKEMRSLVQKVWFNSFEHDDVFYFGSTTQTSTENAMKFDELVRKFKEGNSSFTYDDCLHTEKYSTIDISEDITIRLLSPTKQKLVRLHKKYSDEKRKLLEKQSSSTSKSILDDQKTLEEFAQEPFKKDTSVSNGSSIAFILTYRNEYNFLLLGDAHIEVITDSLTKMGYSKENKLIVQLVKLSHHGSKHNTNQKFLELIESDTFILSGHDSDAVTLSRIILNSERDRDKELYFKFNNENDCRKLSKINAFEAENRKKHNFCLMYLDDNGLKFG